LGVPVVLSDIIGHQNATEDCSWYQFTTGNLRALQKNMNYIIRYQDKVKKEARLNQQMIRDNYNWAMITKALSDLYGRAWQTSPAWQISLF